VSRAVLLLDGRATLLLSAIECDQDGEIDKAHVENGYWTFYCIDGEVRCTPVGSTYVMTRFPKPDYEVFKVPADWRGDYNAILARAEEAARA
jgi:hypothetical protein